MNCEEVRQKMADALDGNLTSEEKDRIEAHFAECKDCDEEMSVLRSGDEHVRSFVKTIGHEGVFLTPGRLNKLESQVEGPSRILSLRRVGSVAAVAAAILIAIIYLPALVSGVALERGNQSPDLAGSIDAPERTLDVPEWQIRYVGQKDQRDGDPAHVYTAHAQELRVPVTSEDRRRWSGGRKDSAKKVYVPVGTNVNESNQDEYWW